MSLIEKTADKLLLYVKNNNPYLSNINDNENAWLKYGIEITISSLLNIFWIVFLSLICGYVLEGVLFLFIFISVRQFTGGFHASSYAKCNLTLICCYLSVLFFYQHFQNNISVTIEAILSIVLAVIALLICPIQNSNKPINSKRQKITLKILSTSSFIVLGILSCVLTYNENSLGWLILVTMQHIMLLCMLPKLKRREN